MEGSRGGTAGLVSIARPLATPGKAHGGRENYEVKHMHVSVLMKMGFGALGKARDLGASLRDLKFDFAHGFMSICMTEVEPAAALELEVKLKPAADVKLEVNLEPADVVKQAIRVRKTISDCGLRSRGLGRASHVLFCYRHSCFLKRCLAGRESHPVLRASGRMT